MPYLINEIHLYKLIDRALDKEEIQDLLQKTPMDRDTLREAVFEYADLILEAGAKQIMDYDLLEIRREKIPFLLRPFILLYRLLRTMFTNVNEMDSDRDKVDEALIRYGIIPQLRRIVNNSFSGKLEK